jgi:hypothetical protein
METIDIHPHFENVTPIKHPEIMPFVECSGPLSSLST